MEIKYLGHSSFLLKGKTARVVTDPYNSDMVGIKFPRNTEADVITISHDHNDHNQTDAVTGTPFIVNGPGEYDIKGIGIIGFPSFHDSQNGAIRGRNTIYKFDIDGVTIVHVGDLGHMLSDELMENIDGADVLMIPVGGTYTIDAKAAHKLITEMEPAIVLPMHYLTEAHKKDNFNELAPLSEFEKEMGKQAQKLPKLNISADKLPEELQIIILE